MDIREATDQSPWDTFLSQQQFRPFLQSWTMGEVYKDTGQEPIRLEVRDRDQIIGICQAIIVDARRGRHLTVPYGPVISDQLSVNSPDHKSLITHLIQELQKKAQQYNCSFIRISPFTPKALSSFLSPLSFSSSPLHLLAEHIWYVPLTENDQWQMANGKKSDSATQRLSDSAIQSNMRKNTRNLIRRAEKEAVTIEASDDPHKDLPAFIELHEETRKRHHFTPYSNAFFEAQVKHFAPRNECTLYKAMYQGEVIAASIHMHAFGETSYHHGASTHKYRNIPASYLLQWTAIQDALKRNDHVYNFWGIAPLRGTDNGKWIVDNAKPHPFAGVTTFKTGFGGKLLELTHCFDVPVSSKYYLTRGFETLRKWKRGF